MYFGKTKIFTDFFMPVALIVYYMKFEKMRLEDYDRFEFETVVELDL